MSQFAVLCFGLVLLGQSATHQAAAAREEVLQELRQYYADFSARDWEAFSSHFWPGASLTSLWQPPGEPAARVVITSVPDFVAQAPHGPGSKPIFMERMTEAEVRVVANLAQVWARYEARFGEPGKVMEWSGIDAFTLMKHEGRWKVVALAYSTDSTDNESGARRKQKPAGTKHAKTPYQDNHVCFCCDLHSGSTEKHEGRIWPLGWDLPAEGPVFVVLNGVVKSFPGADLEVEHLLYFNRERQVLGPMGPWD